MNPPRLRISAIAVGVVVDFVTSMVLGFVVGFVLGFSLALRGAGPGALAAALQSTAGLLACLVTGNLGTAAGGYVAARMARHAPRLHGLGVGIASLTLALLLKGHGGGPFEHAPAWAAAMAWVLVVPVAVLGSAFVAPERVAPAAAAA
jgi:hypothetical protein